MENRLHKLEDGTYVISDEGSKMTLPYIYINYPTNIEIRQALE
jgi:hypothetical protein